MIPLSIRNATAIYSDASHCEIVRHWVDHAGLAAHSRLLRTLVQSLGDEGADEFWRRTLGPIRRTAFALCSTPLPFASIAAAAGPDWDHLDPAVRRSQQQFPDSYALLKDVADGLKRLLLETNTPLLNPLATIYKQHGEFSIVLRNPRMNPLVADFFNGSGNFPNATVVSAPQLRGAHYCDVLVAIGPCGWFPDYVFSAPRASAIHIVSYRWIRDGWKPGPRFLHAPDDTREAGSTHRIGALPRIQAEVTGHSPELEDLRPIDLLPPLPVFGRNGSPYGTAHSNDTEDAIPARLCHLSGSRAVFVAADEGASSLIIDMAEMGRAAVRRVPVDDLEQGMYLLLRTSGGGDFIAPLADRILGATAEKRRAEQAEWKEHVRRRAVERFGLASRRELSSLVSSDLQTSGLSLARSTTVHYWLSSKCIRPRKIEDFAAILKFAGLDGRKEELWSSMGEIVRAHIRAGQHIRRTILRKIAEVSLQPLERDGEMDFELGDQGGGSLSAYEITHVSIQEYEVPADQIGVLLDLED